MRGAHALGKKGADPEAGCLGTVLGSGLIEILDKLSKAWKTGDHGVRGQPPWAEVTAQVTWVMSRHIHGPTEGRCRQSSPFLFPF